MTEHEFWQALRLLINQSGQLPTLGYCDWFEPKGYLLGDPAPRVEGFVGFVDGRHAAQYKFTVALPHNMGSINELDWLSLLPQPDRRGWVRLDESRIAIDTVGANQELWRIGG
jgi:hypothetical protein